MSISDYTCTICIYIYTYTLSDRLLPSPRHPLCTTILPSNRDKFHILSHVFHVDLALWGAALKKINNKTARFARACEEAQGMHRMTGHGAARGPWTSGLSHLSLFAMITKRLSAMISSGTVRCEFGQVHDTLREVETIDTQGNHVLIGRGLDGALERAEGLWPPWFGFVNWASLRGSWHTSFLQLCQDQS